MDMLCQFTFKNFKSFKDEAVLDMQAASITDQNEQVIVDPIDKKCFLRVAAIYGPNGGGKSTVLEAFSFLSSKILLPINILQDSRELFLKKIKHDYKPFKFDNSSMNSPTEFEVYFRINKNEFKYNISILKDKIINESLFKHIIGGKKPSCIFNRDTIEINPGTALKSIKSSHINPSMPYLSFVKINHDIQVINDVIEWFENSELHNYGNPFAETRIAYTEDVEMKKLILDVLHGMDIDIVDYRLQEEKDDNMNIYTKHKINDRFEIELELYEESSGTRKLLGMIPYILLCLREGRLMIVDELDAKLHPKLIRYIIDLFKNPKINSKNAQLIFTSHDLTTMKNDVFRRDEIWFASKNDEEASTLYSLVEFRDENGNIPRKDASFDKQYLEGRYGADPYLQRMLNWEEIL